MSKSPQPRSSAPVSTSTTDPKARLKKPRAARGTTLGRRASGQANQRAAVILEVLAGVRLPAQAARLLNISVTHYYLLERKALEGLLQACEVRPRGRAAPGAEQRVARLERALQQSQRECQRQAALVRATQRAVGLPPVVSEPSSRSRRAKSPAGTRPRRRRKPAVRALRAARTLEKNSSLSQEPTPLQPSSASPMTESSAAQEGL